MAGDGFQKSRETFRTTLQPFKGDDCFYFFMIKKKRSSSMRQFVHLLLLVNISINRFFSHCNTIRRVKKCLGISFFYFGQKSSHAMLQTLWHVRIQPLYLLTDFHSRTVSFPLHCRNDCHGQKCNKNKFANANFFSRLENHSHFVMHI